jgi:predicted double-glycine peptidase
MVALLLVPLGSMSVTSLKEIREAGVVIQKWDISCGAAALATVLTYHFDDPVTEREVAQGLLRQTDPLKVRHRGGFSLLDMKRYVEERGYRAISFKGLSFETLRYLDGPIVPVNFQGYNHYVVYKGLTPEGEVWLADPAFGNHRVSRERFERAWMQGMAFTLLQDNQ